MPNSANSLILVDGSSYLFRAFHALPPLTNSKGVPTGAVYGVLNMLRKLKQDYDPAYMAVVFDPKGKTFRNDLYPEYKANRGAMPEDLQVQIAPLHDAIRALGLPLVVVDGVEADDVIGTLALQAKAEGLQVVISTGDKDMAQLVGDGVELVNTMSNKTLDRAAVVEKFGVPPERIIDYLALMGDTVDNIPGVPGVGPKTAAKWLNEYGTLDDVIANAENIKGKIGEKFRAHLSALPLSRELVTIKLDVDLPVAIGELTPQPSDYDKLISLFTELEFKRWLVELQQGDMAKPAKTQYETILTEAQFAAWHARLKAAKLFAFDTETTSLHAREAKLVGLSFAIQSGEAAYVPLGHDYLGAPKQLDAAWVLSQLTPILTDPTNIIIGQNLKYDLQIMRNVGIAIQAQCYDTLLESYVLNSSSSRHDMDTLAANYLGKETVKFTDIAGKGVKQLTFNQISLEQAGPYAAEDADITLQLHEHFWPLIQKQDCFKQTLQDIEWPLIPVLAEMEYTGVLIDADMLHQQSKRLAKRIHDLEQEVFALAGEEFNLSSTKQLQEVLYQKLELPVLKKTPKGAPSTAEAVLAELAMDYEIPKFILEYRSLTKLKSTYTDALPEQINPATGRVHTSYNQAVTATGRLSSTSPNLQNIPVRTEEGRKIRQAFVAPAGSQILAADYSQVELRIMAHLSQDPGLVGAFAAGHDVHAATAAEVFEVKIEAVTPEQRRRAKAVNFGLMYGMSSFGLAQQLGISRDEAQEHIDVYFARYPSVMQFMDGVREKAAEQGYVETLFGRRLLVPDINASNMQRRRAAERAAINAPLQGTAAEIIKRAMIDIHAWVKTQPAELKMVMQVHDELVFEVPEALMEEAKHAIKSRMEAAADLSVPLVVDLGVGSNWDEAH